MKQLARTVGALCLGAVLALSAALVLPRTRPARAEDGAEPLAVTRCIAETGTAETRFRLYFNKPVVTKPLTWLNGVPGGWPGHAAMGVETAAEYDEILNGIGKSLRKYLYINGASAEEWAEAFPAERNDFLIFANHPNNPEILEVGLMMGKLPATSPLKDWSTASKAPAAGTTVRLSAGFTTMLGDVLESDFTYAFPEPPKPPTPVQGTFVTENVYITSVDAPKITDAARADGTNDWSIFVRFNKNVAFKNLVHTQGDEGWFGGAAAANGYTPQEIEATKKFECLSRTRSLILLNGRPIADWLEEYQPDPNTGIYVHVGWATAMYIVEIRIRKDAFPELHNQLESLEFKAGYRTIMGVEMAKGQKFLFDRTRGIWVAEGALDDGADLDAVNAKYQNGERYQ